MGLSLCSERGREARLEHRDSQDAAEVKGNLIPDDGNSGDMGRKDSIQKTRAVQYPTGFVLGRQGTEDRSALDWEGQPATTS